MRIGTVQEIWRYPVKSLGGERLEGAEVSARGLIADRAWAVRDDEAGVITSAKKFPKLLLCTASFERQPNGPRDVPPVKIHFPDGSEVSSRDAGVHGRLSEYLGRKVTLCPLATQNDRRHYRAGPVTATELRQVFGLPANAPLPDFSMLPLSKLLQLSVYATPPGTYFDAYPLHVLTTSSLQAMRERAPGADFDSRRFRPNLLLDTAGSDLLEAGWAGCSLSAGTSKIAVAVPTVRCSMPSRAQPGLSADTSVMKAVAAHAERCLGVYASVLVPGSLRTGDAVEFQPTQRSALAEHTHALAARAKRVLLRATAAALPK